MKILTTNFLTCAVKSCKSSSASFPLHFRDAVLERTEIDFNPLFVRNILPRVNWEALKVTATELGVGSMVPEQNPGEVADEVEQSADVEMDVEKEDADGEENTTKEIDEEVLKKLHTLLLETGVVEGKLVCGNCGFEYPIKEGVGNFLLPAHLV
jgi:multifunctional methyltransferase subunit TRM112